MIANSFLAVDAGQTGIKVRLHMPSATEEAVFAGIRTHEPLLPQIAAAAHDGLALWRPDGTVVVAAGVSGLTSREADASSLLSLIGDVRVREVLLAHDSTTSYLGALGPAQGAVVAAGTGVVTLAVGRDRVARVDGWGHLMGDAGSGYWIGREALDAVMRAYDGRGPATALRDVVEARWSDLSEAYIDLQSSGDRVSVVASFSASVAHLADDGDTVSQDILRRAGGELAHSVTTALRRAGAVGGDTAVCAIGGAFGSRRLRASFEAHVRADDPDVRFVEPLGQGIDGAVALAELDPSHPLSAYVSTARS